MAKPNKRLPQAIKEVREYLELNCDPDADVDDAIEHLMAECGDTGSGCTLAGTEYCDWECPYS